MVSTAASETPTKVPRELLLVSWNCGGFAKAHSLIRSHYGGLDPYLRRVGAAIFCVQETKTLPGLLSSVEEAKQMGAISEGYRSFWAFNQLKGKLSGFNGVATWIREDIAKSGVMATHEVLRDPLDLEGRCLLVDLGGLAVINVYAPRIDHEDGERLEAMLEKKTRFLNLLWKRVEELRQAGQRVVVCGDLNLTWRPRDCRLTRRWVQIVDGHVVGGKDWPVEGENGSCLPLADVLKAQRVSCIAPAEHALARLPSVSDELIVTESFLLGGVQVPVGRALLAVNGEQVSDLESLRAALQRDETATLDFGLRESEIGELGVSPHMHRERPCAESLRSVLAGGGLVDSFALIHPTAIERFTCWNQHLNLRYSNCGTRLDYILCDEATAATLVATPTSELAGADDRHPGHSREAALQAATSFGRWHGALSRSFSEGEAGLSIQQSDMRLNDTQFRPPHTGLLYTPPSYSDHVAVCALFAGLDHSGTLRLSVKATRTCTPWVAQPGLSSFFGRGTKRPASASLQS